jgi:hypothetical protein
VSAGAFTVTKYQATYDTAQIHAVRVQPETLAAAIGGTANAAPSAAKNNPIVASVSGSKRSNGLRVRQISIRLEGTPPEGYLARSVTRIPCLTASWYALAQKGTTVDYLDAAWKVVGRYPEYPS